MITRSKSKKIKLEDSNVNNLETMIIDTTKLEEDDRDKLKHIAEVAVEEVEKLEAEIYELSNKVNYLENINMKLREDLKKYLLELGEKDKQISKLNKCRYKDKLC